MFSDIVVVMDASPVDQREAITEYIKSAGLRLAIGDDAARIAFISFGADASVRLSLGERTERLDIRARLKAIPFSSKWKSSAAHS